MCSKYRHHSRFHFYHIWGPLYHHLKGKRILTSPSHRIRISTSILKLKITICVIWQSCVKLGVPKIGTNTYLSSKRFFTLRVSQNSNQFHLFLSSINICKIDNPIMISWSYYTTLICAIRLRFTNMLPLYPCQLPCIKMILQKPINLLIHLYINHKTHTDTHF